ncbi:MAG: sensor histidine kinase, partial [Faecousia sp.]
LRLSLAQSSVLNLMLGMSQFIVMVLAGAIVLSSALAARLSRDIVKPINALNLDDPLSNREYEEILPLLRRLESQQRQLKAQAVELEQKQREFHTVTRSLSEGLVLVNSGGTILSINPAAARLLEVTPNCLGADFSVANRNAEIAALMDQALSGQKGEQTVSLSAGEYLAAASPVLTEGGTSGVVLLLFDVTQKQQAEQLRREFTANVSHELKTPLHAISGYAELMKSGLVAPEDMVSFSGKIYSEAQRLIQLVEDILRLSRLDEGAADMAWCWVDLYDMAQAAVQSLTAPAELNNVKIHLEGGSAMIYGIPQLLSGILFNLTDNAVKYNKPGGSVTLRVEDRKTEVRLTVSDTGIGIPEEHQDRIFERFYRVDKSHSKEVGGTGLGLSIVKHAALIHHAKVELTSRVGQGTAITVRFSKEA